MDFVGDPGGTRGVINGWVKDRTAGRIEELLKPEDIESNTVLVLTNAIYFKGAWERPFPKDQTKDEQFETRPGVRVTVPMMHHSGRFRCYAGSELRLLELPYNGGRVSMVVVLPEQRFGLPQVEKLLTADTLREDISKLSDHDGTVAIPRFKNKSRLKLKEPIIGMGMPLAFSNAADFSGMTGSSNLWIKNVIHGGEIEVDEQGAEAAAATAVIMIRSTFPSIAFRADHPFLYLIIDRPTGRAYALKPLGFPVAL